MKRQLYFLLSTVALCLLGITQTWAQFQTGPAYYANVGRSRFTTTCPLGNGCGSIANGPNAVDTDFDSFATLRPSFLAAGLAPVTLRMDMSEQVPKLHRAGVVLGSGSGLSTIGTMTLRTYLNGDVKQRVDITSLAQAVLLSSAPGRVEFLATEPFDQIELEVNSRLNVNYEVDVYYAYGIDANVVETARGVVSRFPMPVQGVDYSTAVVDNNVTVCANSNVLNPEQAADQSLLNYATFTTLVGVSCPNTLRVRLEASAPSGYQAGFVIGQQGLLDVAALATLRITTYKDGVAQEVGTGAQLLQVTVLPDGKQQVSFPTSLSFDEVQLTRSSGVSVLDNLRVFHGFGLEPSVFRDQTPVLSDFKSGVGEFEVASNGVICVACVDVNVLNPERAADNNLSVDDYAEIRTGLAGGITSSALLLNLNGTGAAGNAAGVALNQGTGLLNTQLLNGITLRTYGGPNGDQLLETASGASLLEQGLLPDGRVEVFFKTTQNFQRVEVEINNTVSVLDRTRVYYAFAQDRPMGFPDIQRLAAPLPVVLKSFQAKAAGEAVEVSWQTASELNNRHFVVERAQRPEDGFQALGQVQGAGTSSTGRAYLFRDETANTLGATTLYYRLRQVDTDGKENFSPVAVVIVGQPVAAMLEVYPNPATISSAVQVRWHPSLTHGAAKLAVYDARGTLLRLIPTAEPVFKLTGAELPAGMYHLVLMDLQGLRLGAQRLVVGSH